MRMTRDQVVEVQILEGLIGLGDEPGVISMSTCPASHWALGALALTEIGAHF